MSPHASYPQSSQQRPQVLLGRGALWALVLALLLAPALGRWHEALHAHGVAAGRTAYAVAVGPAGAVHAVLPTEQAVNALLAEAPRSFLERLFDGHTRSVCLVLDEAALG